MTRNCFFGTAFTLFVVLASFGATASAQSTDINNPTVVTQSVIQGKNPGRGEDVVYYYTFTAGPGTLRITTDQKSVGITASANLSWELTDANANVLGREDFYQVTTTERKVTEIKLTKKQKVNLKVEVTEDVKMFNFLFAGAVSFAGTTSSGGEENIPELSGDSAAPTTPQICMPRNGIIVMTMKDGKKAKVDLSKVQTIEIQ